MAKVIANSTMVELNEISIDEFCRAINMGQKSILVGIVNSDGRTILDIHSK